MNKQSLNNLNKLLLLCATVTFGMEDTPIKMEKFDTQIYNFAGVFPIKIQEISCNKIDLNVLESRHAEEINKNSGKIFSDSVEYNTNQNVFKYNIWENAKKFSKFTIKTDKKMESSSYPLYLNLIYSPSVKEEEWKFDEEIVPVSIESNLNHYLISGKSNRLQTLMNLFFKLSESGKPISLISDGEYELNFGEFFKDVEDLKLKNLSLEVAIDRENEKTANSFLSNLMEIYTNYNAVGGSQNQKKEKTSLNILFSRIMYYTENVSKAINLNKNNKIIEIGNKDLDMLSIPVSNETKLNGIVLSTGEKQKEKVKIPLIIFDLSKIDYESKIPVFNIKNFITGVTQALINMDVSNSVLSIEPVKYTDLPNILTSISNWQDKSRPKFINLITGLEGINIKNNNVSAEIWKFITNPKNKDLTIFLRICDDSNNVMSVYNFLADSYKTESENNSSSPNSKKEDKNKKALEVASTYIVAESQYSKDTKDNEKYYISPCRLKEINNEEIEISKNGKVLYESVTNYKNIFYSEK